MKRVNTAQDYCLLKLLKLSVQQQTVGSGALFEAPAANLVLSLLAIELRKGTETMTAHVVCSFSWLFTQLHFEWLVCQIQTQSPAGIIF